MNAEFTIAKSGVAQTSLNRSGPRLSSAAVHPHQPALWKIFEANNHFVAAAAEDSRGPAISSAIFVLLVLILSGAVSHAASAPASAPARANGSVSNAPSYNIESVFTRPASKQEGLRDPFFPKSDYPWRDAKPTTTTPSVAAPQTLDLKLSGISGTPDHRLCIINGKTIEQGEEREVPMGATRINIRVLKIEANTVTVQVGTQQQTLHLRGF